MVCLELLGVPRESWAAVLVFAIPGTVFGVFAGTVLEQWFVDWLGKQPSGQ